MLFSNDTSLLECCHSENVTANDLSIKAPDDYLFSHEGETIFLL